MKLVTFAVGGKVAWGAVVDSGVVNLAAKLPEYPDVKSLIAAGATEKAKAALAGRRPTMRSTPSPSAAGAESRKDHLRRPELR